MIQVHLLTEGRVQVGGAELLDAPGHKWVDVQAPLSLHWTDAQLGQFAAGVHVNAGAEAGVG